ncbi:MAG: group III truncated hemoglobin [Roseovarius sp.]|jgi:hemoglobin|nr:group III truncated hemoglobin [Roseovarius sp.]
MSDIYNVEQTYSEQRRAQLRLAADIMGIDEPYLLRLVKFFVARVNADKRLGTICGNRKWDDERAQVKRMTKFWRAVVLHTGRYSGDLVGVHQNLHGLRRDDFERWLGLFRATVEETAPTPAAANYLITRAESITRNLETALFEGAAGDGSALSRAQRRD